MAKCNYSRNTACDTPAEQGRKLCVDHATQSRKRSRASAAKWKQRRAKRLQTWRIDNPGKVAAQQRRARDKVARALLAEHLIACVDCGCDDQRILEFDHIHGPARRGPNGKRDRRSPFSYLGLASALKEVALCEVRCPNCHRVRHYLEGTQGAARRRALKHPDHQT